jgi:hypothetical protein
MIMSEGVGTKLEPSLPFYMRRHVTRDVFPQRQLRHGKDSHANGRPFFKDRQTVWTVLKTREVEGHVIRSKFSLTSSSLQRDGGRGTWRQQNDSLRSARCPRTKALDDLAFLTPLNKRQRQQDAESQWGSNEVERNKRKTMALAWRL